jgi:hypothetical protein
MAKLGYEKMKGKKDLVSGRLIFMEATVAYELYQKFGISVQPAFYGRKFDFTQKSNPVAYTGTKASQFVLKIGITKFFR